MNGRLMKMELDGNINNKDNIGEISETRLEEIKQEYSNFMRIYKINDYSKNVNNFIIFDKTKKLVNLKKDIIFSELLILKT